MLRKRRGQAAIEFLTTYGWALIAVALVFAALFFFDVIGSAESSIPSKCDMFAEGIVCSNVALERVSQDTFVVDVLFVNTNDVAVTVENLKLKSSDAMGYCTSSIIGTPSGSLAKTHINSFGDDTELRFYFVNGSDCNLL